MLGDYLETGRFRQCYPDLDVRVVQFNDPTSEVAITAEGAWLRQERCGAIDLHAAKAFVYFPCSFEPEDLALRPPDRAGEQGLYHHRQWRVVTSLDRAFAAAVGAAASIRRRDPGPRQTS